MESMVTLFDGQYHNKTVLITGNTGFKGSWMSHWMMKMGAKVIGFSRDIPTEPNHYSLLDDKYYAFIKGDVTHATQLEEVISKNKVDIVFHLAAQSLVRYSYQHALETFETNVMGTANIIEACRKNLSVKGLVIVTSDKCYENFEDNRAYNETDRMGGYDPYSASKGCACCELFQKVFFPSCGLR
jgi:CDP-glucose 4,6-dehydratase